MSLMFKEACAITKEAGNVNVGPESDVTDTWFKLREPQTVKYGKYCDFPKYRGSGPQFLYHDSDHKSFVKPEQGLQYTRFKSGFQRRNESVIDIDRKMNVAKHLKEKEIRHNEHVQRRMQRLEAIDKKNGFNVISGQTKVPYQWKPASRYISDRVSEDLRRTGEITLRNSEHRFYRELASGNQHNRRQDVLYREGLNKPKESSIIGIGNNDNPSYGCEDNFSHSIYDRTGPLPIDGLAESRLPGRYTPKVTGMDKKYKFTYPLQHL